jgi:hypothetical protein
MDTLIREHRLWFCQGSSDKIYVAQIIHTGDCYEVRGQWGRRGKTMQSQVKGRYTSEWMAVSAYTTLVSQKQEKGYTTLARTAFA